MSSIRNLWFDTRHLLGDARGHALLAELNALPESARETVLTAGDRLADISLTLAQVFCRNAPASWHVFGEDVFSRWVQVGEQFVRQEPTSREGAAAYFSIPPDELARLGLESGRGLGRNRSRSPPDLAPLRRSIFTHLSSIARRPAVSSQGSSPRLGKARECLAQRKRLEGRVSGRLLLFPPPRPPCPF